MTLAPSTRTPWFVRWLPRALYLVAALSLLGTFFGSVEWIASLIGFVETWLVPAPLFDWFSIVAALLLGAGLERRKRSAWRALLALTVALLALYSLTLATMLSFQDDASDAESASDIRLSLAELYVNIAILAITIILLFLYRRHYAARTQQGNFAKALIVLVSGLSISTALGLATQFATIGMGWTQAGALFTDLFSFSTNPITPDWLTSAVGLGWAISFVLAMWTLLRSQRAAARMTISDEHRVRQLLADNGGDSLGYFSTRRDKSALFTEHSGATYTVTLGVCLVGGDPLGEQRHWQAAAQAFTQHAAQFGWVPAVIGASEAGARAYQAAGLRALHIGDEAVLTADHFNLAELPEVRRAVRRLTELGYETRIRRHGMIDPDELTALAALADEWRSGDEERGFSMALGRLGDPADAECLMVEAIFPANHPTLHGTAALLSLVPWGQDGASLDVMRRHPEADHGVTELMVAALASDGARLGITKASLNFAVFRSAFTEGAQLGAGPLKRWWRRILLLASRRWQLESLYRSNAKYDPRWTPRLICYPDGSDLGRVATAMGVAEGFIGIPEWLGGGHEPQPIYSSEAAAPLLDIVAPQRKTPPGARLPEQVRGRIAARQAMLDAGIDPYPVSFQVTAQCSSATGHARVAGRVVGLRDHGGVVFVTLRDWSGNLQLLVERNRLGAEALREFKSLVRLGDQLGVAGIVGASRTGTRSLEVGDWTITSKALRPLPDKYHGLRDAEAKVRQRYLDLVINPDQRDLLRTRSAAFRAVRETLQNRGYLEVETPILQPVHGGANARPFRTHINAYNLDLYLRIAPELYLKRLMVGGVDRVFEMGRNFRNEGADATHNPEFTMLEAYQSYADYTVMRDVIRDIVINAAQAALGTTVVRGRVNGVDHEIDLAAPWQVITITDAVSSGIGEHVTADTPIESLHGYADRLGINYNPRWGWGAMLQELYEHLAEATTVTPTFFTDFPAETSPLTRPHRSDARLAERWDLIIFGSELGTAYSELVDPVLQRARLTAQSLAAAGGDAEAMELDEDFLLALEHGMPPSGGLGMGLDRLVMMLTNTSIRQTIAFPLVRIDRQRGW